MVQYLLEQGADKDKVNNNGRSPLYTAAQKGHSAVVQCLVEQGADVNKATNEGWTPLHIAAYEGHKEIISCLVSWGASITARTNPVIDDDDEDNEVEGILPIDVTNDEEIKQLIRDEEKRYRDHGLKRAVIPNPTAAEQESIKRARLEAMGESEYEGQGSAGASAVSESVGQGQATASTVAEEDDDDSGSDEEHEVAYLKSLKRQRTK